jgi:hypothetical protein
MTRQLQDGVVIDEFLGNDADCPVFGFNLACAYPFPAVAAEFYRPIATRLAALDPAVYVYPDWETHITIATLVSFARNRRPSASRLTELRLLLQQAIEILRPVLAGRAFPLLIGTPVLTPKAGILPITDPSGEISRIRRNVVGALEAAGELHGKLSAGGLNVPGIIHSTIMRFKSTPSDPARFAADFERAAEPSRQVEITIEELLLTTETKPYMRAGSVAHRFPLAAV